MILDSDSNPILMYKSVLVLHAPLPIKKSSSMPETFQRRKSVAQFISAGVTETEPWEGN
jgi:hypothetical protein